MLEHFNNLRSGNEKTRLFALTCIANECRQTNSTYDATNRYCVERLAKGMQSTNATTRIEFYTAFVTILKLNTKANLPFLIDSIEAALTTKDGDTKVERKCMQVARILSFGAIILAKVKGLDSDVISTGRILNSLVSAAVKKKLYRSMATPFICQLLKLLPSGPLHEDFVSTINPLLVKSEHSKSNVDYLKIFLTADQRDHSPSLGSIENVQELVHILLAGVYGNDKDTLDLVFHYIQKQNYFEEFWPLLVEQIGPYNSQLFCACVFYSIKNGCPLKYLLTTEVVHLLLSSFHNRDLGKEVKNDALQAFRSLLSWKVEDASLTKKERKKALKRLYRGAPNLLHEYPILVGIIKSHLLCLTVKELTALYKLLAESVNLNENSLRVQLSALGLINHITSQLKSSSSPDVHIEIAKFFFHQGFCKATVEPMEVENQEPIADDNNRKETIQKQCTAHYLSVIRKCWNTDITTPLCDYIVSIINNNEGGEYELKVSITEKSMKLFSKAEKVLEKISDPMLGQITRVALLQLVTNQDKERESLESWLSVLKKIMKNDSNNGNLETMLYILDTVVHEDPSFFNYEAIFRRIVMQNEVPEEVVQALADAIDPGDDDEEEEGIEFDDEDDDDDVENSESESDENVLQYKDGQLFSNKTPIPTLNGGGDSDSEETIDMDDATEEDLERMDKALANVFATKKRIKEQSQQDKRTYMKVLHLVDILIGRYKEPPISVVLMLLVPLVSSLKNNLSRKGGNEGALNRTVTTLKRLNKFKKFSDMEEVDGEILSTMAQEIKQLVKKKFVPKHVKDVLSRSITNILTT